MGFIELVNLHNNLLQVLCKSCKNYEKYRLRNSKYEKSIKIEITVGKKNE